MISAEEASHLQQNDGRRRPVEDGIDHRDQAKPIAARLRVVLLLGADLFPMSHAQIIDRKFLMSRACAVVFAIGAALAAVFPVAGAVAGDVACPGFFLGGEPPAAGGAVLCKSAYAVAPLAGARLPAWAAEHLTAASVTAAEAETRGGRFFADRALPPGERANLSDYAGSGYDRGHMAPAGDMGDAKTMAESMSLANMVPQAPSLNRILWQDIEKATRGVATEGVVFVVTGPIVPADAPRLNGRVAVPSATFKALYAPGQHAGAYVADNRAGGDCAILPLEALAGRIGFDAFPSRPRDGPPLAAPPAVPAREGSPGCPSRPQDQTNR